MKKAGKCTKSREGYILVMGALFLASLIVMLASTARLVNIGLKRASNESSKESARQNALLAMDLAIAKVQKYAGSDLSISQNNMNRDTGHYRWLKLWPDDSQSSFWLVADEGASAGMDIYVRRQGHPEVSLPAVVFSKDESLKHTGSYWISGENEKAPIVRRAFTGMDESDFDTRYGCNPPLLLNTTGLHAFLPKLDTSSKIIGRKLQNVLAPSQIKYLQPHLDTNEFYSIASKAFTTESFGVMTSSSKKFFGFKKDLSENPNSLVNDYPEIGLGALDYIHFHKKITTPNWIQKFPIGSYQNTVNGQFAIRNAPVLTNFMLAFNIRSHSPVSSHPFFYTRARFFCELWNPFTHEIDANLESGGEFFIEIEGLPTVRVKNVLNSSQSDAIDLQQIYGPTGSVIIRLKQNSTDDASLLLPGKTLNYIGLDAPDETPQNEWESKSMDHKTWKDISFTAGGSKGINTGISRIPATKIQILSDESSQIQIRLYHKNPDQDAILISDLGPFQFNPVTTSPLGILNGSMGASFGFHIQLKGPLHSNDHATMPRGQWLSEHDPREPIPSGFSEPDWFINSPYAAVNNGATAILPNPEELYDQSIDSNIHDRLFDRSKEISSNYHHVYQDAPLFELPRRPLTSLAELQHCYIRGERPFSVGNSWGQDGATNYLEWFDRYYFSGKIKVWNHPAYYTIDDNPRLSHAQQHLIHGAFNINSKIPEAWEAILSSNFIDSFEYNKIEIETGIPSTQTASKTLKNAFTRYAHSAHETLHAPNPPIQVTDSDGVSERVAQTQHYRRGIRSLDSEQIKTLAGSIAQKISNRNRPFFSLSEFLGKQSDKSKSIMEEALDSIQEWEDRDYLSSSYLTQADILTSLGPYLTARNDTFKICTTGTVRNQQTGKVMARAICEAIIQKIPDTLDNFSHTVPLDTEERFNYPIRRFQMISFRWLNNIEDTASSMDLLE